MNDNCQKHSTYADNPYLYGDVMSVKSDFTIGRFNEQMFLDLGIAVAISNPQAVASPLQTTTKNDQNYESRYWGGFVNNNSLLNSTITYANNTTPWLSSLPDNDSYQMYNWIRSGTQFAGGTRKAFTATTGEINLAEAYMDEDYFKGLLTQMNGNASYIGVDRYEVFESVAGSWAPYGLVSTLPFHPGFCYRYYVAEDEILGKRRDKRE